MPCCANSRISAEIFIEQNFGRVELEKLPTPLMVRFEGVAGEFAQFDFGQADVRLLDGRKQRVHFAAYRLKYSRWVWIVVVPDERIESLVRALLLCFEHGGGVPLRVVFDNPKTVVTGRDDRGRPIWNQTLAQVAIDYGFTIELCTPRSPEQKGSVENLVGWVKRSFFRARRFADVEHDLPHQLLEWLTVANEERPSRATGEIPALREDAGSFTFEGSFRNGRGTGPFEFAPAVTGRRGTGDFRFRPEARFVSTLRSLGIENVGEVTDHDLKNFAWGGVGAAEIREFIALGLAPLTFDDAIGLAVRHVTPEYVRGMQSLDVSDAHSVRGLVDMRIFGDSLAWARELAALGYRGLSGSWLIDMRRAGVTPDFIRKVRAAGYPNVSPDVLIDMRRRGIEETARREGLQLVREEAAHRIDAEEVVAALLHGQPA